MTELATSRRTGFHTVFHLLQARRASISRILILVLVIALLGGLALSAPWLLWTYNIHQAGKALAIGLRWPTPRVADSLPQARDVDALQAALGHLAAARRWQPERAYSYRLAGQIYAAQHDWLRASQEYAQALAREPKNPLLAWESALVYEQLEQTVAAASRENILPDLASALPEAQATPISPADCYGQQPGRCFVGLERWSKPYAASPDGPVVTYATLVMHAPGGIRLTRPIYASHPVLSFVIGLDPNVLDGQSDGATYSLWVETDTGSTQVYRRTLDQASARQGWIPEMVDLTSWAGQTVTLVLRLDGGPSGNIQDDWYGWGNVLLTTREAAEYALAIPAVRLLQAWSTATTNAADFEARGDIARETQRYWDAVRWYQRATLSDPEYGSAWYKLGLCYEQLEEWEAADGAYARATKLLPDNRDAWYGLGRTREKRNDWNGALKAFRRGLEANTGSVGLSNLYYHIGYIQHHRLEPPDPQAAWKAYEQALAANDYAAEHWHKAQSHYQRGTLLAARERWDEALREYQAALALDPSPYGILVSMADVLWKSDRVDDAKGMLLKAIQLAPDIKEAYKHLGAIYRQQQQDQLAIQMYEKALEIDPNDTEISNILQDLRGDQ
ncbi:tetratricopeptide repeat protein [Kallotenue papyrolyticum]|uniref:tetratricopeptide repeat protein n=1 Tax=Kallotenue papyrolyticum TaxID=1325125 RepID=UPI000492A039|nr:tetratricopeptide repeat protein [Kallotenue papyrolyticum]